MLVVDELPPLSRVASAESSRRLYCTGFDAGFDASAELLPPLSRCLCAELMPMRRCLCESMPMRVDAYALVASAESMPMLVASMPMLVAPAESMPESMPMLVASAESMPRQMISKIASKIDDFFR